MITCMWRDMAHCAGMDTDLFYPPENIGGPREGRGVPGEKERIAMVKKICLNCVVRKECLQFAFESDDQYGILGGLTPAERKNYRR